MKVMIVGIILTILGDIIVKLNGQPLERGQPSVYLATR